MLRRSELVRRTPLRAGDDKPLRSRTEMRRGGPLNPVSAKHREMGSVRKDAELALGMTEERQGRCAFCKAWTRVAGHERLRRSQGGNPAVPDCLLCDDCNEWAARHGDACAWGWAICKKHDPLPLLAANEAYDIDGHVVRFSAVAA